MPFLSPTPTQPKQVLSHWYVLTDGVQFSSQEFYSSVEDELAARKVPRLKSSRVEFFEGSAISDKRIYLRLARERYAFDVCAAQFGTGYFFSLRFVEMPRGGWLQLLALLGVLGLLYSIYASLPYQVKNGVFWAFGLASAATVAWWLVRQGKGDTEASVPSPAVLSVELPDFDAFIINLPVIGEWYERYRKDTYYRHDTRLLYHTIVSEVVKKKVEEITCAKGVKLIRTYDYSPILGELYKRATVKTDRENDEPPLPHAAD